MERGVCTILGVRLATIDTIVLESDNRMRADGGHIGQKVEYPPAGKGNANQRVGRKKWWWKTPPRNPPYHRDARLSHVLHNTVEPL